jgi:F-type H+-transporting ATPase subunit delta
MAEKSTIARPYALAAFRQAQQEENLPLWSEMLEFAASVAREPRMARIISDPRIPRDQLEVLYLQVCNGRLSETGANFIRALAANRRLNVLPEIHTLFEQSRTETEGRADIHVTSAYAVNPKYKRDIAEAMAQRLGREVNVTTHIDRGLIAGIIVKIGDRVIDLSFRSQLNQLAHDLRR